MKNRTQSDLYLDFKEALKLYNTSICDATSNIELLFQEGLNPNSIGESGVSLLLEAIDAGAYKIGVQLVNKGGKVSHGGFNIHAKLCDLEKSASTNPDFNALKWQVDTQFNSNNHAIDLAENATKFSSFVETVQTLDAVSSSNSYPYEVPGKNNKIFKDFKPTQKKLALGEVKYSAKYHSTKVDYDFILTSADYPKELMDHNTPDIKEKSKTYFKDGKIYSSFSDEVINVKDIRENGNYNAIYVLSKNGELYVNFNNSNTGHHNYFLKGKPGDDLYCYGKPVACAGHIEINNGKITKIDNSSGHYKPTEEQLLVAAHYFKKQGVLSDYVQLYNNENKQIGDYTTVENVVVGDLLANYDVVEY